MWRRALLLSCLASVVGVPVIAAERPLVAGRNAGVSAGHPLTTAAAFEILQRGGNAFDAGAAALLVRGVVEQDLYGLGGEGLVLVYPMDEAKVTSIVGQGWAAKAATIDWYQQREKSLEGKGLDPGRGAGRAPCGTYRARAMGHDELRGSLRALSSTRGTGSRCGRAPRGRSSALSSSFRNGRPMSVSS